MPGTTEKTGILSVLGDRLVKAYGDAVTTPVKLTLTGNQLPPGINNGIAHLRDLKFDEYKTGDKLKGKPCFVAEACAIEPKQHGYRNDVGQMVTEQVEGTLFWMREPLCDTLDRQGDKARKSLEEHFKYVVDWLITFGWEPPKNFERLSPAAIEQTMRNAMAALVKKSKSPDSPICFHFRTWRPKRTTLAKDETGMWSLYEVDENGRPARKVPGRSYKFENEARMKNPGAGQDPQTQAIWMAVIPGYKLSGGSEQGSEMSDQSGGVTEFSPSVSSNGEHTEEPNSADSFDEFADLDSMVEAATNKDSKAEDKLTEMAVKAGYTDEEVRTADSWEEVADMIRNPSQDTSEIDNEHTITEEEFEKEIEKVPEKGGVVHYRPIAAKTGKPSKNAVECEITGVSKTKKTVTLLLLKDRKTKYEDVPWDSLE